MLTRVGAVRHVLVMAAPFTRGRYHVRFGRVRTSRALPTAAELPVYEVLVALACLSEATLQGAASELEMTKRAFTDGHTAGVGLAELPREVAEHLGSPAAEVSQQLGSLIERNLISLDGDTLLLPERARRRAVEAWNEQMQDRPLAQLPRVMFPRRRDGHWAD